MNKIKIYVLNQDAIEAFEGVFNNPDGTPTKDYTEYLLKHNETESYSLQGFIHDFNAGDISDTSFVLCVQSDEANEVTERKKMGRPFEITSICREDLLEYMSEEDALKIDDDTMKRISEEIAECIMSSFWTGLEYAFEKLEIKHSKKEGE